MSPVVEHDPAEKLRAYAHPERLVTTGWLAEHLDDPGLVVAESDEDVLLYDTGHIPGAVKLDWHTDLNDPVTRDYVDGQGFARLMSAKGITPDTTIVFYGDKSNWWAAYALWVASLFGHADARLLAGWTAERQGRPEAAVEQYRAALELTRPLGASPYVAFVLAVLGRLALRAGELDRARSLQGEAAAMVDPTRSPWFAAFTHHSLAVTLRRSGNLDGAAALYRQAVAESLAVGTNFAREVLFIALVGSPAARSLIALGALARSRGDLAEAERLGLAGLERAERDGDAEAIALALEGLAATGDAARAATLLGAAESVRATARARPDRFEAEDADQAKAAAASALGSQTLDRLIARGRGLRLEEAVAVARQS